MSSPTSDTKFSFWSEFGLICKRGCQVWRKVHRSQKRAFAAGAILMALTSISAVAIPVVMGQLVDAMSSDVQSQGSRANLLWTAGQLLGLIAVFVIVREVFNVLRRFVV